MTRLTSVHGSFRAHVLAARLESEGFEVELRGALDGLGFTVGDIARVDVFVPAEDAADASLVLLVDEVDEADEVLDDDRPPAVPKLLSWRVLVAGVLVAIVFGRIVQTLTHAF